MKLPNDWTPRDYQIPAWEYLQDGGKRAVLVWHRRAGKDSLALNFTPWAAMQRVGTYWHMLPTLNQARKVVWNGIDREGRRMIDQAFPKEIRIGEPRETDMQIQLMGPSGEKGSIWQCVGSDNYDALIGANPIGIVFSEWAVADPKAWELIRPILLENNGWAIFPYTPRGQNHGLDLYEMASQNEKWFCQTLTVDDTKFLPPEVIEEERASGMDEDMIQQEYYVSFTAARTGSFYGHQMRDCEENGRVGEYPHDPGKPVHTSWDLGFEDSTAIWFFQLQGGMYHFIDYYEASGAGIEHYARMLQGLDDDGHTTHRINYSYGDHVVPFDIKKPEMGSGKTILETMNEHRLFPVICPKVGREDGIQQARTLIAKSCFDKVKCERGVKALKSYRREWDDKLHTFKKSPLHDWSSHASDSFRYCAVGFVPSTFSGPIEYNFAGIV